MYAALSSKWADRFNIYPNLPLLNIIDVEKSELSRFDFGMLKKSSVDYTLCTKTDAPILSVEFDGLGYGFSRDGKYVPVVYEASDPHRATRLNRKLYVAMKAQYPFVVVSHYESAPLGEDTQLTLIDGIIGQVLARRKVFALMNEWLRQNAEEFEHMSREQVQELICDTEVVADLEENPIAREAAIAEHEASLRGVLVPYSVEHFEEPPLERPASASLDWQSVMEGLRAFEKVEWVGCRVTSVLSTGERISTESKIRNISGYGASALTLVDDVTSLLHWKKVLARPGPAISQL